jgi:hypothetical protein
VVDELLDKARVEAVQAANVAAELAYIRAFNEAYDQQYRRAWERGKLLNLASKIIHSREFRKKAASLKKSIS